MTDGWAELLLEAQEAQDDGRGAEAGMIARAAPDSELDALRAPVAHQ